MEGALRVYQTWKQHQIVIILGTPPPNFSRQADW